MQWLLVIFLFVWGAGSAKAEIIGGDRPVRVQTPRDYDPTKSYPLLIFLHGYTGNSTGYERYLNVTEELSRLGVISIVPDGTKNSRGEQFWNATPECCDFEASGVDDRGYLSGLIQEAKTRFAVDSKRIYLMGHSNGGFMSYRMACETELVAGIVSIAGATFKTPEQCLRPSPLRVLQIHGEADEVVPYGDNEKFPSPSFTVNYWKNFMACQTSTEKKQAFQLLIPSSSDSRTGDTDQVLWENCKAGNKVGLWTIPGGSHSPAFAPPALFSRIFEFLEAP